MSTSTSYFVVSTCVMNCYKCNPSYLVINFLSPLFTIFASLFVDNHSFRQTRRQQQLYFGQRLGFDGCFIEVRLYLFMYYNVQGFSFNYLVPMFCIRNCSINIRITQDQMMVSNKFLDKCKCLVFINKNVHYVAVSVYIKWLNIKLGIVITRES